EAHAILKQILAKVPIEQEPHDHAFILLNIAEIDAAIGTPRAGVQKNVEIAKSIFSNMEYERTMSFCDLVLADLDVREGNLLKAQTLFKECLASSLGTDADTVTCCLERLGDMSRWSTVDWSTTWTTVYLVHALKSKQRLEIHKAFQFLGDVFLAQGDESTAMSLFAAALDGFTQMDVHRSRAECMLRLGDNSKLHGNVPKAVELWKTARLLFQRSSQAHQVVVVDERLADIIAQEIPGEQGAN
ncbi:hypothetical protein DFH09DRAFT_1454553, partial [Mycena vulgaris]